MRAAVIRLPFTSAISPPPPTPTPVTVGDYHAFDHSLFTYTGGDSATETAYTNVGEWWARLAVANGSTLAGSHTFGQFSDHNALTWPANITVTGAYPLNNSYDPTAPGGNFDGNDYSHVIVMPSNFLEADMGAYPFSASTDTALAEVNTLYDNIRSVYPSAEVILYVHWPDSGNPRYGTYPLGSAGFTTYNSDTVGSYLDWHVTLQNAVNSGGRTIRTIPVGPVIADVIENIPALSALTFGDYYGDSAPHGTENIYLLAAMVMYRAMRRENPSLASFTVPAEATQVIAAVESSLSAAVIEIEARLSYYDTLPGPNRVIIYD